MSERRALPSGREARLQRELNVAIATPCTHDWTLLYTQDKDKDRYVVSLGAEAERKLLRLANLAVSDGYPNEGVLRVHDPLTYSSLRSPLKLTRHHMPLVFGHPNVTSRSHESSHEAVSRDDFERQFHAFTSGIFADWEPSLWSNVLVAGAHRLLACCLSTLAAYTLTHTAGGAVLASLLPVDPNFARLKPASSYLDYDFYFRRLRTNFTSPPQKLDNFMREVLWPHSDVDLFVYGLEEQEAQAKLLAIASSLRRALLKRHGMDTDVCFIKVPCRAPF